MAGFTQKLELICLKSVNTILINKAFNCTGYNINRSAVTQQTIKHHY